MMMPIFYGRHGCPQLPWFVLKQTQLEFSGEKIPSLFPFLTLSWLLHFQRKTLPYLCLAGWLAATQTSHTQSYGLCTNCACCLQHCYPRYLRVSFLISCWFYFCMRGLSMITLLKQLLHCPTRSLIFLQSIHHHLTYIYVYDLSPTTRIFL